LVKLKKASTQWTKEKFIASMKGMERIEGKLEETYENYSVSLFAEEYQEEVKLLEEKRLLSKLEDRWRIKSRAIWLK